MHGSHEDKCCVPAGYPEPKCVPVGLYRNPKCVPANPQLQNSLSLYMSLQAMLKYDAASREVRLTADRDYKAGKGPSNTLMQWLCKLCRASSFSLFCCLLVLHLPHAQTHGSQTPAPLTPPLPQGPTPTPSMCLTYHVARVWQVRQSVLLFGMLLSLQASLTLLNRVLQFA